MTTLYKLTEQVRSILAGGDPDQGDPIDMQEAKAVVVQILNSLLKTEHFQVNLGSGEMTPNGLVLASYDGVAVSSYKNVAKCTLPAIPVHLPLNMGVFHISKTDDIHNPFIPIQNGLTPMLAAEPLISDLLGQVGYEVFGKDVVFNRDITADSPAITSVFIRLVVVDPANYSDYDIVPIPPEMEIEVIKQAVGLLAGQKDPDKLDDVITDNQKRTA